VDKLAMTEQKCRPTLLIFLLGTDAQLLLTDDFLIIIDVPLLTARPQQIGIPSIDSNGCRPQEQRGGFPLLRRRCRRGE